MLLSESKSFMRAGERPRRSSPTRPLPAPGSEMKVQSARVE